VVGAPATLRAQAEGFTLSMHGYARLKG